MLKSVLDIVLKLASASICADVLVIKLLILVSFTQCLFYNYNVQQVFGLGSLSSLRALLSQLFHLPTTSTEESDLLPRSNHSSGEKSLRGELHNTNNNTNASDTGNATVGIVAKSSQRKSKISKKASTYTTTTNNPTKDFTSDMMDSSTLPNTTSFGNSNSKNLNLRPGVSIINTNNPIIRTEMDSLRVLAEADSTECAVGLRILNAWIE